jgi:hypothetical protein
MTDAGMAGRPIAPAGTRGCAVHLMAYDLASLRAGPRRAAPNRGGRAWPGRTASGCCTWDAIIGSDTLVLAQQAPTSPASTSRPGLDRRRPRARRRVRPPRPLRRERPRRGAAGLAEAGRRLDVVFTTWGAIGWLPDIEGWARRRRPFPQARRHLRLRRRPPRRPRLRRRRARHRRQPGWFPPYFHQGPLIQDDPRDYADPTAPHCRRRHTDTCTSPQTSSAADAGRARRWSSCTEHDSGAVADVRLPG